MSKRSFYITETLVNIISDASGSLYSASIQCYIEFKLSLSTFHKKICLSGQNKIFIKNYSYTYLDTLYKIVD